MRRAILLLSALDVKLLAAVPYDHPGKANTPVEVARARRLEKVGLLERDPSARHVYRCTDFGTETVQCYRDLGWIERS